MAEITLPVSGYFSSAINNGQARQAQDDVRAVISTLLGADAPIEQTINAGSITPDNEGGGGYFTVDTESDSNPDNLDNIVTTNVRPGTFLMLAAQDAAREVRVRHAQGGDGEINLADGATYGMDNTDKWILLRMVGTSGSGSWSEIMRGYGADNRGFRNFHGIEGTLGNIVTYTGTGETVSDPSGRQTTNGQYDPTLSALDALKFVIVLIVGGGGGSGGSGTTANRGSGGGGAGEFRAARIDKASLTSAVTVQNGGGASGGGGLSNGGDGGTSAFGSFVTAAGGSGSNSGDKSTTPGGEGGTGGSGGFLAVAGGGGGPGSRTEPIGGVGGASVFGGGGRGASQDQIGDHAGAYGAGGGGASTDDTASSSGGNGEDGHTIVLEYF